MVTNAARHQHGKNWIDQNCSAALAKTLLARLALLFALTVGTDSAPANSP
jgi:hypothetical protein